MMRDPQKEQKYRTNVINVMTSNLFYLLFIFFWYFWSRVYSLPPSLSLACRYLNTENFLNCEHKSGPNRMQARIMNGQPKWEKERERERKISNKIWERNYLLRLFTTVEWSIATWSINLYSFHISFRFEFSARKTILVAFWIGHVRRNLCVRRFPMQAISKSNEFE